MNLWGTKVGGIFSNFLDPVGAEEEMEEKEEEEMEEK